MPACSSPTPHPPGIRDSDASISPPPARVCVDDAAPPSPDAQGYCGNTFLKVAADPPNLYFVIDHSGSMLDVVDGVQKYPVVARAATDLVRSLGARVNVGAAIFPGRSVNDMNACAPGEQVFLTRAGDLIPTTACGDGPTTRGFAAAISIGAGPFGSTPTAATLAAVLPIVVRLPGKTAVVLATDGGPNCNFYANCDATKCIPNIEHQCPEPSMNCCTDAIYGGGACLDEEPTRAAVAALFEHGIPTYVIGIPGSSPYAALLDQLALAGGTARPMHPAYFDVEHLTELDGVLASIGAKVALSCHIRLDSAPARRALVNVYLDREQLTYGSSDGWIWSDERDAGPPESGRARESDADGDAGDDLDADDAVDEATDGASGASPELDIVGAACDKLESGAVQQLEIVFGCPTAVIR